MSRIIMAGFETGDTAAYGADSYNHQGATNGTNGSVTVVSTTPTPRNGNYCLKTTFCTPGIGSGFYTQRWQLNFGRKSWQHAAATELWYAFGYYAHHYEDYTPVPQSIFFQARDSQGNTNVLLAHDAGQLRPYVATNGGSSPTTAQLANVGGVAIACSMDAWHLLEVHIIAATGNTGTLEIYVDTVQQMSTTNIRTAQVNANLGLLELGFTINGSASGTTPVGPNAEAYTSYHAFDDVRVNDTTGTVNNGRLNDGAVGVMLPNGVGTTLGGTPLTPTGSGTNWQNVDETPPSTTDYNSGTVVGTGEMYAVSDPSISGVVQAVNVLVLAGGSNRLGITVKTPAGTSEGAAQGVGATPSYSQRLLDTDPNDSAAWTLPKLFALEAGITLR